MSKVQLYFGDCLQEMKKVQDSSVDMILCDLPYEVLHKNNPNAEWDRQIPLAPLWQEYTRVIKENGAIVLFGQGMFSAQLMMSNTKLWRYNLIWDKCRATGFLNANRMPLRYHEDILVFYKSLPVYNPQMEQGQPNHSRGTGTHKDTNNCYGKYKSGRIYDYDKAIKKVAPTRPGEKFPGSIIRIKKEHETTVFHPTQKPVALMEYLIRTFTNEGALVMDNTMGSGTTGVAAVKNDRDFIGIERNEKYFLIAQKRINDAQREREEQLF